MPEIKILLTRADSEREDASPPAAFLKASESITHAAEIIPSHSSEGENTSSKDRTDARPISSPLASTSYSDAPPERPIEAYTDQSRERPSRGQRSHLDRLERLRSTMPPIDFTKSFQQLVEETAHVVQLTQRSCVEMAQGIGRTRHLPANTKDEFARTLASVADCLTRQQMLLGIKLGKALAEEGTARLSNSLIPSSATVEPSNAQPAVLNEEEGDTGSLVSDPLVTLSESSKPDDNRSMVQPPTKPQRTYAEVASSRPTTPRQVGKPRKRKRSRPSGPEAKKPNVGTERPLVLAKPKHKHSLVIRPRDPSISDLGSLERKIFEKVCPIKSGIALRDCKITKGGLVIIANSEADLAKLRREIERTKLEEIMEVSKSRREGRRITMHGVPNDLNSSKLVSALRSQNDALRGASIEVEHLVRRGKRQRAVLRVDSKTYESLREVKRLHVGWTTVGLSLKDHPVQCYRCWTYGHVTKHCKGPPRCGRCGRKDHAQNDCSHPAKCPNCAFLNRRRRLDLPTEHPSGSRECPVYRRELELAQLSNDG